MGFVEGLIDGIAIPFKIGGYVLKGTIRTCKVVSKTIDGTDRVIRQNAREIAEEQIRARREKREFSAKEELVKDAKEYIRRANEEDGRAETYEEPKEESKVALSKLEEIKLRRRGRREEAERIRDGYVEIKEEYLTREIEYLKDDRER